MVYPLLVKFQSGRNDNCILDLFGNPVGSLTSPAFFRAKALQKCCFYKEVVQKLKFPNNSIFSREPTRTITRLSLGASCPKFNFRINGLRNVPSAQ